MWFQTQAPDDPYVLASKVPGYWFHCPDVAAIDEQLMELARWAGPSSGLTPDRKNAARQDIDRLLDVRLVLAEAAGVEPARV